MEIENTNEATVIELKNNRVFIGVYIVLLITAISLIFSKISIESAIIHLIFFIFLNIGNYIVIRNIGSIEILILIKTQFSTYSFGYKMSYEDFKKINSIIEEKIKGHKNYIKKEEIEKKYIEIYNLKVEERYNYILNKILDEEKLFISEKDNNFIVNGDDEVIKDLEIFKDMNFEEIDFYVFYVNYLSKKEYENKKVLVGYNGTDRKEVTMSKFKEDINEIRESRSTFKNQ